MAYKAKFILGSLLVTSLLFTACSKDGAPSDFAHASLGGNILESHLPGDVSMLFSYSLLSDEQFATTTLLQEKLGDENRFSKAFSEGFNQDFSDLGLDYEKDLKPAFGDQFRMIFAGLPGAEEGTSEAYSVVTLQEPDQMISVFDRLVEAGELAEKKLSGFDAYTDEQDSFYATVFDDLLFVTNVPENLIQMVEQDSKTSLWANDLYQDDLKEIGNDYLFYLVLYPNQIGDVELPSALNLGGAKEAIKNQAFVIRAEEDGFALDGYAFMDKDLAQELNASFESVPKERAYLHEEVPADGLMAYVESYGLKQTVEEASKLDPNGEGLDGLSETIRNYTAMDLEDEILTFMDQGYSIALHQNDEGVLPGLSIYMDVSSDAGNAQRFMDKLDGQLAGLITLLESGFPGAVSRETIDVQGVSISSIVLDLSAIPRTGPSPLPASILGEPMKLSYGIVNDRLLITTANVWEEEFEGSIADDPQFKLLSSKLTEVEEGILYVDAQGILAYTETLRALRQQLDLDTNEDGAFDFEELFDGFEGGVVMSETKEYEARIEGFLMISE